MEHTWFLDKTHASREAGRQLRKAGVTLWKHGEVYQRGDLDDPIWVKECAEKGWLIISGDKGLEQDGINRQAVIQSKAMVFILSDTESKGIDWAAALVTGRKKIEELAKRNRGPFFVSIDKNGDDHVHTLRFVGDGGPNEPEAPIRGTQLSLAAPEFQDRLNDRMLEPPVQGEMFDGQSGNQAGSHAAQTADPVRGSGIGPAQGEAAPKAATTDHEEGKQSEAEVTPIKSEPAEGGGHN